MYFLLSLGCRTDIYTHIYLYMNKGIRQNTHGGYLILFILRYTFFSHFIVCEPGIYLIF